MERERQEDEASDVLSQHGDAPAQPSGSWSSSDPSSAQAHEQTNARLDALEAKSTLYDGALKAVMPLIELPLMQGRAEQQLRVALPAPVVATTTALVAAAPVVPVTLDIDSVELTRKAMNDMYQELAAAKLAIVTRDRQLEEKERQRAAMERLWNECVAERERLQRRVQELMRDPSYRAEMRGERPPSKRPHLGVSRPDSPAF